jgi:hypothetical protein
MIPGPYKAYLVAAALVGAAGAGWFANGWRLGKKVEAQKADYYQARARRGEDYADTLVKAAQTASGRIQEAQAILEQARRIKAQAVKDAAAKGPQGAEWECLDRPLPADYVEEFRK